jgi:hypothetical protein
MSKQLHENYPYKMYRDDDGKIVLVDCSKKPHRLLKMLRFLKKEKPSIKYVVVESKLVIIEQS